MIVLPEQYLLKRILSYCLHWSREAANFFGIPEQEQDGEQKVGKGRQVGKVL